MIDGICIRIAMARRYSFIPVLAWLVALSLIVGSAWADDTFAYRGFTVDISAIKDTPGRAKTEASLAHQLDIIADCGARPEILAFFRTQQIAVKPGMGDTMGWFGTDKRVLIDAAPMPPQEPIVLHELLHAYHRLEMPDGFRDKDVLVYYLHAKEAGLYTRDSYVLKDPAEFFAVTASLYLWGHVDREPFDRETLRKKQPYYYAWLGQLFGVKK
jgi:hypothetical protein